ncbi:MAG TPA: methyltransferase domain-containing protein [Candidatus Methylomirabilis sp.]|nr:methyltransferase domain-containing protein [Candidatus Methylomirabilis sp.]
MIDRSTDRRITVVLAITLLAYYLLIFCGHQYSRDGVVMFQAAKQLLFQHSLFLVPPVLWGDPAYTSKFGIGMTLAYIPLLILWWPLFRRAPDYTTIPYDPTLLHNPVLYANLPYLLCSVLNPLITAATACLVFRMARLLGLSAAWSLAAAAAYGVASPAATYARFDYAQPLAGLALSLAAWQLLEAQRRTGLRPYVVSGLSLGYGILTRTEIVVVAAWAIVWVWMQGRHQRVRTVMIRVGALLVPTVVGGAIYLWTSQLKFGAFGKFGYSPTALFTHAPATILQGLAGLLISPTTGILVFFPLSVLVVPGLMRLRQRRPEAVSLFAGMLVVLTAVYSSYIIWWGGWSWGPRFLIPLVPIITLAATAWAADSDGALSRRRMAFALLAILGFVASLNGILFDFLQHREWASFTFPIPDSAQSQFVLMESPLVTGWRPLSIESLDLYWVRLLDLSSAPGRRQILAAASAIGMNPSILATATGATMLIALLAVISAGGYTLWKLARAIPAHPSAPDEHSFWTDVGVSFPSLKGAASTAYYFECERGLFERFLPDLAGRSILKTDLWDEAKNTEILRWAADRGACPFGVDISLGIVRAARRTLARYPGGCIGADVRALPFGSRSFDAIYSMGTIEHSAEYAVAAREIARVLKPGGVAIVGVPNKLDPFLRPLLVHVLNYFGLYSYGFEKSFTPRELRRLLEAAGLRVTAQTGILFMPGWLRMADLWCHVRASRLSALTGAMVRPFAWLSRTVPAVRRHGYLTVCVVTKPIDHETHTDARPERRTN